ncbi:hypothetical protein LXA43DRAFT_191240 [Ganoderma leucocontextum]|nr:hypothetical protein LXA43DRAFT_191240 [Ganoderma leucocontextum]
MRFSSACDSPEQHELLELPEYDDSSESSPLTRGHVRKRSNDHSLSPLLRWGLLTVAGLVLIDLVAMAYVGYMFNTVFEDRGLPADLEFANPYIGLKELYESGQAVASNIEPIITRPRLSAQVFINEPDRPAPRGERDHWIDGWGTLSPNERRLHVTPEVHTITQFRTIDFGMEDCHLVLTVPELGTVLEAGASFTMHPQSHLDVFRLTTNSPIDPGALMYRTRPKGAEKVGTVHADALSWESGGGDIAVYRFKCPRASLHTFEVACAVGSRECFLDAWSSQNTTFGINIIQYQTV